MDIIADWLAAARVSGSIFSRSELNAPWGLLYPAATRIAFHIILEGKAYLRLGPKEPLLALDSGDIVLLASGSSHELLSSPNQPSVNLLEHLAAHPMGKDRTIRVDGSGALTRLLCGAYELDRSHAGSLLSVLPPVIHLNRGPASADAITAVLELLVAEFDRETHSSEGINSKLIDVLLVYVLRSWGAQLAGLRSGWIFAVQDSRLAAAIAKVHEFPGRNWTVEDMASEAGLSRSAFAQRFTEMVGEAPLAYVRRWRLVSAARMLTDTALPIAEIAGRIGYSSIQAFCRAFLQAQGMPPGEWRAKTSPAMKATG